MLKSQAFELLLKYPRLHLANYVHRTASNQTLDFENNKWQIDLYLEDSDQIVIMKSSKTGVSEWLIADMMVQAKFGLNGMYILPDQNVRNRFITSRVDKIIGNTPEYRMNVQKQAKDVNAKSLKTIYGKTWAYVGANNPATFYEFNSDINIYDEYDKCNVLSLETATDRTLGSKKDRWRKVGNPTISGFGISGEYEKSCQYEWMIRCESCNEWQSPDWFKHFIRQEDSGFYKLRDESVDLDVNVHDGNDAAGYCIKCDKPINRLAEGEWVAKFPKRLIKGYHVKRLFGSIAQDRNVIREDFQKMKECLGDPSLTQWFYNNRLGIPYESDGSKVSEALLEECCDHDYLMADKWNEEMGSVIGGADIGSKIHITASCLLPDGTRKKVVICSIPLDIDAFEFVINKFKIKRGVVDALPETDFIKKFLKRNRGWRRCFYNLHADKNIKIKVDHPNKKVQAGRTETLDGSLGRYVNGEIKLPKNFRTIDNGDFLKQMTAPTRIYDEKRQEFVWIEGNQADHYRHADNYENIAFEIFKGGTLNIEVH